MTKDYKFFGSCMHISGFALLGKVDDVLCLKINKEMIEKIEMHPTNLPATIWKFPTHDGKGGDGATVVESLTESFVAWDYWTQLEGTYFFLVSCKKYDILMKYFEIKDYKCFDLSLVK